MKSAREIAHEIAGYWCGGENSHASMCNTITAAIEKDRQDIGDEMLSRFRAISRPETTICRACENPPSMCTCVEVKR